MKKILTLMSFISLLICDFAAADEVQKNSEPKNESRFYIKKGGQLELCREVKKILDEPENKDFGKPYLTNAEFVIPARYKNFSLPKWENISSEELPKYIASKEIKEEFETFTKQNNRNPLHLRKTMLDFNNDGTKETVLSFSSNPKSNYWSCIISDITPSVTSTNYNKYNSSGVCYLFFYKGKIYKINNSDISGLIAYEPIYGNGIGFGMKQVCTINVTKKASAESSKALEEEVKRTVTPSNSQQ